MENKATDTFYAFPGIDSPYERPEDAEVIIHGAQETAEQSALNIVQELERKGLLSHG